MPSRRTTRPTSRRGRSCRTSVPGCRETGASCSRPSTTTSSTSLRLKTRHSPTRPNSRGCAIIHHPHGSTPPARRHHAAGQRCRRWKEPAHQSGRIRPGDCVARTLCRYFVSTGRGTHGWDVHLSVSFAARAHNSRRMRVRDVWSSALASASSSVSRRR